MSDDLEVVENDVTFELELEEILSAFKENNNVFTEELEEKLSILIKNPKEVMDLESYLPIMYLEGMKYDQKENKNAARYCAMRILWMKECMEKKRKKRPRFLLFTPFTLSEDMILFMDKYTDFLENTYKFINRRLLMVTAVLFIVVFGVLTFFMQINFWFALVEAILLGIANYYIQKRRMPDIFQKNQLNAISKYVEEDVLEFDRPIRYS